ncbi:MAG: VOC family protein, partial [Gammaproteobacteria bacterium]
MLDIKNVNHIGIRVKEKARSIKFYELLGFVFTSDAGFEQGHPIVMKHASGVVLNLLGPANMPEEKNILMDVSEKYTGITHMALTVGE